MLLVTRLLCVGYWGLLTILLLVPDPFALLGITRLRDETPSVGVHFAFFAVLAVVAMGSRWPVGRVAVGSALIGFALATELLQRLVPHRTVDVRDLLENFLGLLVGAIVWQVLQSRSIAGRVEKPVQVEGNS